MLPIAQFVRVYGSQLAAIEYSPLDVEKVVTNVPRDL